MYVIYVCNICMYICICIYVYIYIYVYVYMYVYMYVYICIYFTYVKHLMILPYQYLKILSYGTTNCKLHDTT